MLTSIWKGNQLHAKKPCRYLWTKEITCFSHNPTHIVGYLSHYIPTISAFYPEKILFLTELTSQRSQWSSKNCSSPQSQNRGGAEEADDRWELIHPTMPLGMNCEWLCWKTRGNIMEHHDSWLTIISQQTQAQPPHKISILKFKGDLYNGGYTAKPLGMLNL